MSKVIRYSAYLPKWEDVCVAMNAKDERILSKISFDGEVPDKIPLKISFDEKAPDRVSFLHTSSFQDESRLGQWRRRRIIFCSVK